MSGRLIEIVSRRAHLGTHSVAEATKALQIARVPFETSTASLIRTAVRSVNNLPESVSPETRYALLVYAAMATTDHTNPQTTKGTMAQYQITDDIFRTSVQVLNEQPDALNVFRQELERQRAHELQSIFQQVGAEMSQPRALSQQTPLTPRYVREKSTTFQFTHDASGKNSVPMSTAERQARRAIRQALEVGVEDPQRIILRVESWGLKVDIQDLTLAIEEEQRRLKGSRRRS